ncbi:MAG: 2-amino-4-hydroxy-6-hydroxymethyldihydropteridine diphosphokinase [Rubripirellula sp.]
MNSQCLISFGSNLGRRDCLISDAAKIIADSPYVDQLLTSRLFETPPIGGPSGQEPFLNAVGAFETSASAREILKMLQQTEQKLGRERKIRWDARSIDLDVVLHGELVGGGTGLIVPHPRYTARQFVLQPACDVAAHYRDPRFGWTIQQLAEHLEAAAPSIALVGGSESLRIELCDQLNEIFGITTFPTVHSLPESLVANSQVDPHQSLQRVTPATNRRTLADPQSPPVATTPEQVRDKHANNSQAGAGRSRSNPTGEAWVSGFVPHLESSLGEQKHSLEPVQSGQLVPRLIGRIQSSSENSPWPAPHQMWPSGWNWPEYRLEIDDKKWAVCELFSAIDSMRCPVKPITEDGHWWE